MRAVRLALVGTTLLLVLALVPASDAASPPARAYLDRALNVMRQNALYTPSEGWAALTRAVHARDAGAARPRDEYAQIRYAIERLRSAGDLHAVFMTPQVARVEGPGGTWESSSSTPAKADFSGRFGLIALPGIVSGPETSNSRLYAETALADIGIIQKAGPCGWIVDLRRDTGGDIVPMLLAVGPILGSGRLLGFTAKKGFPSWISYDRGTLSTPAANYLATSVIRDLTPAPAVAVLTGPRTYSAGEVLTIAFRGRPQTRSFGADTGGAPTEPAFARLPDGAFVSFAIAFEMDRYGVVYRGPIPPDVTTASPLAAAKRWLATTPACS